MAINPISMAITFIHARQSCQHIALIGATHLLVDPDALENRPGFSDPFDGNGVYAAVDVIDLIELVVRDAHHFAGTINQIRQLHLLIYHRPDY